MCQHETATRLYLLIFITYHLLFEKNVVHCITLQTDLLSGFGIFQNGERILRKTKPAAGKQNASAESVKAV